MSPAVPVARRSAAGAEPAGRPSLRLARAAMRSHGLVRVGGMDEVGRGALAGPVSVGVVVVDAATRSAPAGLDDSKRLSPAERERLFPLLARWAPAWAVGHADNDEIDAWGILVALRVAGLRALAQLGASPERVLLDGTYDWLHRPFPVPREETLFDAFEPQAPAGPDELVTLAASAPPVDLMPKADRRCAAVAAASVLAKVERDRMMSELGERDRRWGWQDNKGYSAPEHLSALLEHGPCGWHRRSWRLPGRRDGDGDDGRDPQPGDPGPGEGQSSHSPGPPATAVRDW
ncbi:ribonuclease HII [Aquipuribacter sp. MA13-6]|uniref:ribonuclease HII n=1 Tax=unclassified Aquipuribacter TaxID=2635084 RepID=UPI003EEEE896